MSQFWFSPRARQCERVVAFLTENNRSRQFLRRRSRTRKVERLTPEQPDPVSRDSSEKSINETDYVNRLHSREIGEQPDERTPNRDHFIIAGKGNS